MRRELWELRHYDLGMNAQLAARREEGETGSTAAASGAGVLCLLLLLFT